MRIKSYLFPLLAAGALTLTSCQKNAVSLSFTNAKGEVPVLGNLVFRFNHSLAFDSMLNVWDSTDYISFEPALKGRFRWQSPDELVFSPAEPLNPATNYKAKIRSSVLKFSKYNSVKGGDKVNFHTPLLTLDNTQVVWVGESSTTAVPQLDMIFNYRVNPSDLKDRLSLEIDGKKADFSLLTVSTDNKMSVRINGLRAEDRDLETKLTIKKGLKPEKGNTSTEDDIINAMTIPSPFTLTVQNLESEFDGSEGQVRVITSQQLTGESIRSFVRIEPDLAYTIEPNDYGFTIRSDKFDNEKAYALVISKGLRGKIGGVMKEDYNGGIGFGEMEADIRFTNSKAVYLSKKGGKNIEVQINGVQKLKLVISKIYENNLLMAQRYGYSPKESKSGPDHEGYEDDYYYDDYGSGNAVLGDVIYEKEIDTRSLPKSGAGRILNFSQFEDRLPEFRGVYHVMIRSADDYWVKDSRFISLSDIGLIAREGNDKIYVFANSIKSAGPLNGVNVAVYAVNNQLLGTATTDKDGMAAIGFANRELSGFMPAMLIAKTDEDFNYMPFNSTKVNTSRFEVGGKRNNPAGFDAFVYAERDVYRPGEKINFSVILRNAVWENPGDVPLKIKFLLPNGKELKTIRKSLNEEGSLEGNLDISQSAITGTYTMEVYTSNDILLSAKSFAVEEFVPDRIRVRSDFDRKELSPGQKGVLSINAMNFFGPPAANRKYESEIQLKQKAFSPEKFEGFDFSLSNLNSFYDKQVREGSTDEAGNASFEYEVPLTYANSGVLQASFYSTVFDETGRPVSRGTKVDVFTQNVFFGIQSDGYYYSPLNQPVKFVLAAVNREGNGVSARARIELIKHEYRTVLTKSGTYFRYESQKEDKIMSEQELQIGNNTPYNYVPKTPGDYEVRVYLPGAGSYVSRSFYSYGNWGSNYSAFEVSREGNIDISVDKKSYNTGETVKALFKTPFSGKMLVTLETDHIISHQMVEVSNRTASLDLKLTTEHLPNVYITATLIKPHEISDIPLTVAHGFQNIIVEEKGRKMPVEITAAKTVRSKTKQKVSVKAAPGSMVTLSAVDNGVLQISDYKTPDPYDYFYQKKALQVAGYDLYPLLFEEVRARLSSTGGDGAFDLATEKRNSPIQARRVRVVSYWSGIKKANGSGIAEFEFEIPQFSGELRLMAVSYKGHNFGAADNTMTVADPVVISTALPRFLSPGDTVNVPVTLTNTTEKATTVTAIISATGPVKVAGSANQSISLAAKAEARASFKVVADPSVNTATLTVTINALGEKFTDATEIAVRPPSTLQRVTGSGSVSGGGSEKVNISLSDFMPSSVDYRLLVSRSPVLELGEQLRYLVQYPYGCTEQTVSAAFPQLYYGDLADLMHQNKQQEKTNAVVNIMEAIRKIKMRQLYNGAVTLWDGEGKEEWWTTIYAAHFLLEAKKAGFDVDNSLLNTMLNYISNKLRNRETITYYYNRDQNKKIAPKEVAYGLYVLALAGRTNVPAMNYYKANTSLLALDSRYLLAAAYATAGDKRSFAAMLPASFSGEESVAQTGGSFYSDIRDEAIALNALLEVDPGNAQIGTMVKHVSDKLKGRRWLSTQERAFAFLALGKHARTANNSTAVAEIRVNGKLVGKADEKSWAGDRKTLGGNAVEISAKGNGRIYYFWQAEGISVSGAYTEEDSYLKIRKKFFDRNGRVITGTTFKQNDLIIVGITLERSFNTPIENIVITDLLPAGFEIENPRTKEIPGMDWIKDASTPDALDVRDDRIHFFVNADQNKQTYYYAVRAVSPGNYKMGPVNADAMYNGEYHSYNGAGTIKIIQ